MRYSEYNVNPYVLTARYKCAAVAMDASTGYVYYAGVSLQYTKTSYIAVLKPMGDKHFTLVKGAKEITSIALYSKKG